MVGWWVGNALGVAVVVPLLLTLAVRLIRVAREADRYADDILGHGVGLAGTLDPLPALADTRRLVGDVAANASAYVSGVRTLAGGG